jgi:hypothetical protein
MQTSDPDVRLMLAFRGGDQSALSDLYRKWAGPLLRYLPSRQGARYRGNRTQR